MQQSNGSGSLRSALETDSSKSSSQYSLKLPSSGGDSSVSITKLESRSVTSGAIQAFIRPIKARLTKVKEHPGGSIPLTAPEGVHEHCTVHERSVAGIYIYDINVRSESTDRFVPYADTTRTKSLGAQPSRRSSKAESVHSNAGGHAHPRPGPSHLSSVMTNGVASPPLSTAAQTTPILEKVLSESPPSTSAGPKDGGGGHGGAVLGQVPSHTHSHSEHDHFPPLTRGDTDSSVRTKDWAMHHDGERRKRPRQIYYIAGGSWQMPPTKEHWKMCTELARQLTSRGTHTTVSMISQPLAPHTPAAEAFPMLEDLYYELFPLPSTGIFDELAQRGPMDEAPQPDPEIILAGDSSGGNVALALTLHVLKRDPYAPVPASLMLISPAVDMRVDNPAHAKLDKKDAVLSIKTVREARDAWRAGKVDEADPRVSPILADLSVLRDRGVHVNGVNAGYDIIAAEVNLFLARMEEERVMGRWLQWEKQMHVFPLIFSYGVEEGKKGLDWMVNCIDSPLSRVPQPSIHANGH